MPESKLRVFSGDRRGQTRADQRWKARHRARHSAVALCVMRAYLHSTAWDSLVSAQDVGPGGGHRAASVVSGHELSGCDRGHRGGRGDGGVVALSWRGATESPAQDWAKIFPPRHHAKPIAWQGSASTTAWRVAGSIFALPAEYGLLVNSATFAHVLHSCADFNFDVPVATRVRVYRHCALIIPGTRQIIVISSRWFECNSGNGAKPTLINP